MNNLLIGAPVGGPDGAWVYYETVAGGQGGRPGAPGMSGVHTGMTNTRNTPIEALERTFPLRVRRYRLRSGSGGAGEQPGGEGIERDLEVLEDVTVSLITERRVSRPPGLGGGAPGATGENWLLPGGDEAGAERLPDKCTIRLAAGDVVRVLTPGGGGWGDPGADEMIGAVDLLWIPLGAGQRVVRASGRAFEALSALVGRRRRRDLYHSALTVTVPEGRAVIEMAPIPDRHGERRGVVAEGPVGMRWAGRLRVFRYENRCWRGGVIPDADAAVATVRVAADPEAAQRLLDLVPEVPTPVWGRDELGAGEMWNSNSVTSWLLQRSGVDMAGVEPPEGGRAPGWAAGLVVAAREPG